MAAVLVPLLCACAANGPGGVGIRKGGVGTPDSTGSAEVGSPLRGGAPVQPQAPASPGVQSTQPDRGTVDGGGGAGFKGKPLEAYFRDVSTLEEFKAVVDPVVKSVGRIHPEFERIFQYILKARRWHFLGAPIPSISKERQGAPVSIDQWAVQDAKEIWFSDKYAGGLEERGTILLHEILVGLKILRFLSAKEYCYAMAPSPGLCEGGREEPVNPAYKLSRQDHQDVRAMVTWLVKNHMQMTGADFAGKMHENQFQSLHHSWRKYLPTRGLDLGPVTLNYEVERVMGKAMRLFTNFERDGIARGLCEVSLVRVSDSALMAKVRVTDIQSRKKELERELTLVVDPKQPLMGSRSGRGYGRYRLELSDGRKPVKRGDERTVFAITFSGGSIEEILGGDEVANSATETEGSSLISFGVGGNFLCKGLPLQLPPQYDVIQEMRTADRVNTEKFFYGGRTVDEMIGLARERFGSLLGQ